MPSKNFTPKVTPNPEKKKPRVAALGQVFSSDRPKNIAILPYCK